MIQCIEIWKSKHEHSIAKAMLNYFINIYSNKYDVELRCRVERLTDFAGRRHNHRTVVHSILCLKWLNICPCSLHKLMLTHMHSMDGITLLHTTTKADTAPWDYPIDHAENPTFRTRNHTAYYAPHVCKSQMRRIHMNIWFSTLWNILSGCRAWPTHTYTNTCKIWLMNE